MDKVNIHTDLNLLYLASVREYLKKTPKEMDMRNLNGYARAQLKQYVKQKIDVLGSSGKA